MRKLKPVNESCQTIVHELHSVKNPTRAPAIFLEQIQSKLVVIHGAGLVAGQTEKLSGGVIGPVLRSTIGRTAFPPSKDRFSGSPRDGNAPDRNDTWLDP